MAIFSSRSNLSYSEALIEEKLEERQAPAARTSKGMRCPEPPMLPPWEIWSEFSASCLCEFVVDVLESFTRRDFKKHSTRDTDNPQLLPRSNFKWASTVTPFHGSPRLEHSQELAKGGRKRIDQLLPHSWTQLRSVSFNLVLLPP
ncbi:hypothetical protein BKA70DRAFT_1241095 [Coprinopsis sp. MPI-PUGE-AT-0042]|nr:hypothetical protein BKA70DRAFT_1241095 [Coprinopsis sp. MPI-PUGE-AT-0042]